MFKHLLLVVILLIIHPTPVFASGECVDVRVLLYNVTNERNEYATCNWSDFRKAVVIEDIRRSGADLVALQEMDSGSIGDLNRALTEYNFEPGSKAPSPFAYKKSLFIPSKTETNIGREGDTRAQYTRFTHTSTGNVVDVYNYHFNADMDDRKLEMLDLNSRINRSGVEDVVVLGDFNEAISGPHMQYLLGNNPLDGVFLSKKLVPVTKPLVPEWNIKSCYMPDRQLQNTPGIDHIFVSDNIEIVNVQVVVPDPREPVGSQHWPVVADLKIGQCTPTPEFDVDGNGVIEVLDVIALVKLVFNR
jgi:endonuclease/exonuclease/phosphatase family metal-dependent hydrolase